MATNITARLTADEFIKVFGDTQYVRPFTPTATYEILRRIEQDEDNAGHLIDWTARFMDACEYEDWDDIPVEDRDSAVYLDNSNWLVL